MAEDSIPIKPSLEMERTAVHVKKLLGKLAVLHGAVYGEDSDDEQSEARCMSSPATREITVCRVSSRARAVTRRRPRSSEHTHPRSEHRGGPGDPHAYLLRPSAAPSPPSGAPRAPPMRSLRRAAIP